MASLGKDDGMERFWKADGEARLFAFRLAEEKGFVSAGWLVQVGSLS